MNLSNLSRKQVIPNIVDQEWYKQKSSKYTGMFRFCFWRFGEWIEVSSCDLLAFRSVSIRLSLTIGFRVEMVNLYSHTQKKRANFGHRWSRRLMQSIAVHDKYVFIAFRVESMVHMRL